MAAKEQNCPLSSQHVLYALACVENEASVFLRQFNLTASKLETKYKYPPSKKEEMFQLNARAAVIASELGERDVNCIHMLLALLSMPGSTISLSISLRR